METLDTNKELDIIKSAQEIERIAWKVFLNRNGLSFKRELTAEEKKSVTDVEDYEYYRDIAKKIHNKKQLAVLNKKYPIIDVPASGKPCWWEGAYTLLFVYSKYKGNFVLRGYNGEVEKFLKDNYTHYFCYKSMWCGGESRSHWNFWKKDVSIFEPNYSKKRRGSAGERKFIVRQYSNSFWGSEDVEKNELVLKFKRLPKQWISEFDKF